MKAYLDNSATTRPTPLVIRAMTQCMEDGEVVGLRAA